jgi:predicted O-methyltransferase YrrM
LYSRFQLAKKYLQYYFTASNGKGHGMHSPFVFDFILNVLNNGRGYALPEEVEKCREKLLGSTKKIDVADFGAGSRVHKENKRAVAAIALHALKPPKYAGMLYRLAYHYKPSNIIELGTSLGITTAYLAKGSPKAEVYTIEGSSSVRDMARSVFNELAIENIKSLGGKFDVLLPEVLGALNKVDVAYVDGNHRLEPTMNYFSQLVDKSHNDSILIFDDIHWSKEMEQAWDQIKAHPSVRCSIDLFFLGMIFFRSEFKEPQHFKIRF